jgi:surfeit locus 1 family protein
MNRPLQLNLNWKMSVFSCACLVSFISLGFWQLDRTTEKVELLKRNEARTNQPALPAADLLRLAEGVDGLPVTLSGYYHDQPALLRDNVVLNGRVGFEVLQVFTDSVTNQAFLVDRGFVPMAATRLTRPQIPPTAQGKLNLFGHVYVSTAKDEQFSAAELMDELGIVQSTNPQTLEQALNMPLYPHLIRLNAADPFALPRYWLVTTVSPDKHMGYAVQWFLMAFAVLIAFGYFTLRSPVRDEENR